MMEKHWHLYLENGEEKLNNSCYSINRLHPITKFRTEWSKHVYDVTVSLTDCKIEVDLQVGLSDSHLYLHSPLCHFFSFKKSIVHSQTVQLNLIFYFHCSNLEQWIICNGSSEN